MKAMLTAPEVPAVQSPDLLASWGSLPVAVEVSPLVLAVLLAIVGVFVAAVSVVLMYHWRRFPFEHATFRWAERIYLLGVTVLLLAAVAGVLATA